MRLICMVRSCPMLFRYGPAMQLRIMAAHLTHNTDQWDRLARQSKEWGYNQQALDCYRKVYSLDPSNVDALWDRESLAKEMGEFSTARNTYMAILQRFPQDLTVLHELNTILVELSELPSCGQCWQETTSLMLMLDIVWRLLGSRWVTLRRGKYWRYGPYLSFLPLLMDEFSLMQTSFLRIFMCRTIKISILSVPYVYITIACYISVSDEPSLILTSLGGWSLY